jgi:hypothetical protein
MVRLEEGGAREVSQQQPRLPKEKPTQAPTEEPRTRVYAFFDDEHALIRRPTDGMQAPQVWNKKEKNWTVCEYVDFIHRARQIPRDQAARRAGGEENLDLPVDYEADYEAGMALYADKAPEGGAESEPGQTEGPTGSTDVPKVSNADPRVAAWQSALQGLQGLNDKCPRCGNPASDIEMRDSVTSRPRRNYGTWHICTDCRLEWPEGEPGAAIRSR